MLTGFGIVSDVLSEVLPNETPTDNRNKDVKKSSPQ